MTKSRFEPLQKMTSEPSVCILCLKPDDELGNVASVKQKIDKYINHAMNIVARSLIAGGIGVFQAWLFGLTGEQRDWFLIGMMLFSLVFYEREKT